MPPAYPSTATDPSFDLREDGRVRTNWKALIAIAAFVFVAGGAFYKLQNHDQRLDKIESKVDDLKTIATEIKARLPDRR